MQWWGEWAGAVLGVEERGQRAFRIQHALRRTPDSSFETQEANDTR